MNKLLISLSLFTLLAICPAFAGNKLYTDEDLENYNKNPNAVIEKTPQIDSDESIKDPSAKDKEIQQLKDRIERLETIPEGLQRTISGKVCDVIDFNASQSGYAAIDPYTGTGPVILQQKVVVTLKNKYGLHRWVKNFIINALFVEGSRQSRQLKPAMNDNDTTWIGPYDTYTGSVTFEGDMPIISLSCTVDPG